MDSYEAGRLDLVADNMGAGKAIAQTLPDILEPRSDSVLHDVEESSSLLGSWLRGASGADNVDCRGAPRGRQATPKQEFPRNLRGRGGVRESGSQIAAFAFTTGRRSSITNRWPLLRPLWRL